MHFGVLAFQPGLALSQPVSNTFTNKYKHIPTSDLVLVKSSEGQKPHK